MMQRELIRSLRVNSFLEKTTCTYCRRHSRGLKQAQKPAPSEQPKAPTSSESSQTSKLSEEPKTSKAPKPQAPSNRPHVRRRDGELVPTPLNRALGLAHPPQSGENSGKDTRTWRQVRDDYGDYDSHLRRRREILNEVFNKNQFRDLGNVGVKHRGKSIISPQTPYRSHLAAYFPNLIGRTLASPSADMINTTPTLRGRISIVSVVSVQWAGAQCASFTSETANPELHELMAREQKASGGGLTQIVEVQIEENFLKWGLVRMFMPWRRRRVKEKQWGKYFLVKRGMTDEIREALGMWNSKVGYVFLLDGMCKIRWAGNGDASEEERKSLVNCVRRLIDEAKGVQKMRVTRQDPKPTKSLETESTRPTEAIPATA